MSSLLPNFALSKFTKPLFLLGTLLFVLGAKICFGQLVPAPPPPQLPQVINNDLFVTKKLHVGRSPGITPIGQSLGKLNVAGMTTSGPLTIGPWPANPNNYVFFGVSTLSQEDSGNYALLQKVTGGSRGQTLLNSPSSIRFRIKNKDKMILSSSGSLNLIEPLRLGSGAGTDAGIEFYDSNYSRLSIYSESEGDIDLVRGGGNVGIGGLARNNVKLTVHGSAEFTGRVETDQYMLAKGFTETSDAKLKTQITPIENALGKLEQIRGVSFKWNDKSELKGYQAGQTGIGLIAQEVEAVFPEVVFTSEEDGYKAIDYGKLTSVLIESVKELKAMNEMLQRKVEALENQSSMATLSLR